MIGNTDVLYVTRIQKERFPDPNEYEKVKGSYKLNKDTPRKGEERAHRHAPSPKVNRAALRRGLREALAAYMTQAHLGVPLRMALLLKIMGGGKA